MAKKPAPPSNGQRGAQGAKGGKGKGKKGRKENIWVKLGRKLFGEKGEEKAEQYAVPNPLYTYDLYTGERIPRPLPKGLTEEEKEIVRKVRRRAYNLDYECFCCKACNCCGIRFGKTTFFGIIPGAGPIIDVTLGITRVNIPAQRADLPWKTTLMMYFRHVISEGIGLTPFVGGIWIAYYQVNSRNSYALERSLAKRVARRRGKQDTEGGDN